MTPRFDLCKLTFEHGTELGDEGHSARSEVLADGDLLEEDRDTAEDHRDEVDEEEGSWNNERMIFWSIYDWILVRRTHCFVQKMSDGRSNL